ncbi:MAG: extensin family protein [Kofleriaceae bacterium]
MARLPLVIALVAGVTGAAVAQPVTKPTAADATTPAKSTTSAKTTPSAAPSASAKKAKSARAKRAKRAALAAKAKKSRKSKKGSKSRKLRRTGRGDNMPRGFSWPPNEAMRTAGERCEGELDALGVEWQRSPTTEGRIVAPVEIPSMVLGGITYTSVYRKPPHRFDCQLAVTLASLGPALHALGVREVKFGSIYRWSNVRAGGTTKPFLSRHALGLAMDIVSFVDDTGRTAVVATDYLADDELLLGIERLVNESGKFRIVLTPRNDPKSHHDHFHIEANPDYRAP